ncbi:MAG: TolC family protein [Prevotella sp.]|nr:TolC family protein [Prevotella sp.]MDY4038108.1 TolC family protein [Prevotella sp.]
MKRIYITMMTLAASTAALAQEVYSADQIKQLAVEHNIRMRTANNAYLQAKEQQREAFTNYFPQVSATGIGFRSNKDMLKAKIHTSDLLAPQTMQVLSSVLPTEALGQIPPAFGMGMLDKGILGSVTAVQPVFAGGQIVNGNKLAKVGVEVGRLQQLTSRNEVVLTAEKYYWQIVTLKEKRRTLDAVSNMLAALEKDAEAAVKAGVAMRNDLLQVQLKQNEIENNRIKLDNALRLSKMVLAQYIGKDGQDIDVSGCADPQQMPDYPAGLKADPEQAVATTPEYRLLQKNVEAKDLQRRMELGSVEV